MLACADTGVTVTTYPSGSGLGPAVETLTTRSPELTMQVIAMVTEVVTPGGSVSVLGLGPVGEQLAAISVSSTVWLPVVRSVNADEVAVHVQVLARRRYVHVQRRACLARPDVLFATAHEASGSDCQ
jgi:hypothetical protein